MTDTRPRPTHHQPNLTHHQQFKDHCNNKSNQKNLGTIKSSNLCTEIIEYTSPDEVAVCNLASVNLSAFVVEEPGQAPTYDLQKLYEITKVSQPASPPARMPSMVWGAIE